jgi:tRNA threonylcarbamoyl adenosine modification protein TsaD
MSIFCSRFRRDLLKSCTVGPGALPHFVSRWSHRCLATSEMLCRQIHTLNARKSTQHLKHSIPTHLDHHHMQTPVTATVSVLPQTLSLSVSTWSSAIKRATRFHAKFSSSSTAAASDIPKRPCKVLGIESTCDETGVAIVDSSKTVHVDLVASQWELYEQYDGVFPTLAAREHAKNLPILLDKAMDVCDSFDAVAVAAGPGLAPCLDIGIQTATQLAKERNVPLIAVNHLEAHLLVCELAEMNLQYPYMALLVSGGHTMLLRANGLGSYELLGSTLDDAIGECFDKAGRLMGIHSYDGRAVGAIIEEYAQQGDPHAFDFSIPLYGSPQIAFSFSGLKTAVRRAVLEVHATQDHHSGDDGEEMGLSDQTVCDMAASFQRTAAAHLAHKVRQALRTPQGQGLKQLVVSGGVASNSYIRQVVQEAVERHDVQLVCPPQRFCTDNGVMIAWAGLRKFQLGHYETYDIGFNPRWSLG